MVDHGANVGRDILGFLISRIKLTEGDLIALAISGPERLVLTATVIRDHFVRCIENVLGRTVILLELDYLGIGIMLLEVQDVIDVRTTELIDGLVIITDNAEVLSGAGQQANQLELGRIGRHGRSARD